MMDQEIKAKWVEALRSGEYKQGKDYLKTNDDCYCCLGVLAEINGVSHRHTHGGNYYHFDDRFDSRIDVPNGYCGIDSDTAGRLQRLNDGWLGAEPKTFPEIADFIEKNL